MTPEDAARLKAGDKVHHAQAPVWKGVVVRVEGPFRCQFPDQDAPVADHYRVWWKGHDPYDLHKEDWTWDWAMGLGHP